MTFDKFTGQRKVNRYALDGGIISIVGGNSSGVRRSGQKSF